ncbi:MAG TPA: DUF4438 domain-containing protein [Erysipelotrichaceae bacterium]|nr:DUF4438 domain-containing protein [Erysipelotrichaceae bacterium]
MLKTNIEKLVMQSVQGRIHHPVMRQPGYRIGSDGVPRILPATAAITYNAKIGDVCMGLMGDHVEPGVSMKNADANEDAALNVLACVGNVAKVITGDGKGALGVVTGKHGGADHVMVYFDDSVLDQLAVDDKILIKSFGQGLQLVDYPDVICMNLDPSLLDKLDISEKDGKLEVGVAAVIPAYLMGSGLGSSTMMSGDYDIMTRDPKTLEALKLDQLKFGDLVFIEDHANNHGPDYLKGSGTLGVIIHGDSFIAGHGPGVTVLLTSRNSTLVPKYNPDANLKNYI